MVPDTQWGREGKPSWANDDDDFLCQKSPPGKMVYGAAAARKEAARDVRDD